MADRSPDSPVPIRLSPGRLAAVLAARLDEVMPPDFRAVAEEESVGLHFRGKRVGGSVASSILEDDADRADPERIRTAVWATVSSIQDDVATTLTSPWPTGMSGEMALPECRIEAGTLLVWFGEREETAALRLRPIQLAELSD
jgi:hypothetical protein